MTPTPPLKCECEEDGKIIPLSPYPREGTCDICHLPIHPTAETKHPDSCTASVKEPSYMHSEMCPLRRSTTKTKPYKSWEETWLEDVPTPSPVVEGEWKKKLCEIVIRDAARELGRAEERDRIVKMIDDLYKKLMKKARVLDYADRTEYDEAAEMVSSLRDKLTNK